MTDVTTLAQGRYILARQLGEGGMATVYRAYDQRLQVWRAIKVLLPQYSSKKKVMARFEAEAQMMALLEHPHIVRVYDVGREDDQAYIVMELVEGGALVDWLERHGPMPPRLAVDVIIQTCRALDAAHQRGVVHRDIKPHNIMVDRTGSCRLTDFGIARAGDMDASLTKTGAVMGTWGYMAPEQRSDAKHVDARADVYAIAATLYSLLTDRVPMDLFAADRDASMMEGIHEALLPALSKATSYRREDRHDTALDFARDLEAVLDHLPPDPDDTPALAQEVGPLPPPPKAPAPEGPSGPAAGRTQATILPDEESGRTGFLEPGETAEMPALTPEASAPVSTRRSSSTVLLLAIGGLALMLGAGGIGVLWVALDASTSGSSSTADTLPDAPTPEVVAAADQADAASDSPASPDEGADDPSEGDDDAVAAAEATKPKPSRRSSADDLPKSAPSGSRSTPDAAPAAPPKPAPSRQCINVDAPVSEVAGGNVVFTVSTCLSDAPVILFYRSVGGPWYSRTLPNSFGKYRTSLRAKDEFANGIEYYIESAGVTAGTKGSPRRVIIE